MAVKFFSNANEYSQFAPVVAISCFTSAGVFVWRINLPLSKPESNSGSLCVKTHTCAPVTGRLDSPCKKRLTCSTKSGRQMSLSGSADVAVLDWHFCRRSVANCTVDCVLPCREMYNLFMFINQTTLARGILVGRLWMCQLHSSTLETAFSKRLQKQKYVPPSIAISSKILQVRTQQTVSRRLWADGTVQCYQL